MPHRRLLLLLLMALTAGCSLLRGEPMQVRMKGDVKTTAYAPPNNTAPRMQTVAVGDPCHYADPKVGIIDVDGVLLNRNMTGIGSMGENPVALFREKLDAAAADPSIRAIVLRINSPGGGVSATDTMRHDLEMFKLRTGLPVIVCITEIGAGGAYYLALSGDVIVAHPTALVGGVGVILNLYNLLDAMQLQSVIPVPVRAGENIDLGSPAKLATEEERAILQQIADQYHARFRHAVAEARPARPPLPPALIDGRIFIAPEALDRMLIDRVAYLDDALMMAKELGGLPPDARVALFRRATDRAMTIYDVTPNIPTLTSIMPLSIPGLDRSQLPTFLYMWQPEPLLEKTGGR
jgi:protease IV